MKRLTEKTWFAAVLVLVPLIYSSGQFSIPDNMKLLKSKRYADMTCDTYDASEQNISLLLIR